MSDTPVLTNEQLFREALEAIRDANLDDSCPPRSLQEVAAAVLRRASESKAPLLTSAERVSDLRLVEIQRSFIMALEKGDPNYMVSLEWNEGVSIINELLFKRSVVEPGEERVPIDSPSEICPLVGCRRRDDHQHVVIEHPSPVVAPRAIPCTCTTHCMHRAYPDAPIKRGVFCKEARASENRPAPPKNPADFPGGPLEYPEDFDDTSQ